MKTGTIETLDEAEDRAKPSLGRGGSTSSGGGGNGGRRGPGGGGSDGPRNDDFELDPQRFVPGKSRILTGFLLVVVSMTFGGLIAAYIVIATNGSAEWQPFALPFQVWISTLIILLSSLSYHFGKSAIVRDDQASAKKWMIVTTVLGAMFISSQLLAWLALTARGLYVASNPYAGFFYVLTAVHAFHVLGGMVALGSIVLRVWAPAAGEAALVKRSALAQVVGWYWHFMGALWIVLLVLLGFWK